MGFTVAEILAWTSGRLCNEAELGQGIGKIRVVRPAPLEGSTSGDLCFFFSKVFQGELPKAAPGILIVGESFVAPIKASGLPVWKSAAVIACADPYLQMARLSRKFAEAVPQTTPVIHPSAVVASSAKLGVGVSVGPHAVIEENAVIGARTKLYPGCFVGRESVVGEDCVFFPNVVLYEGTKIGSRVRIHASSVIGSDGFGYSPVRDEAKAVVSHEKIYHLGTVVIGDDVEIGASSTVDRGTFGETRIDRLAKLDNQVHIGHNAFVAEGAVICGGTCLAGNARVGKFAYVGGLTGITNHVQVGDGAQVGACALVTKDVPAGGTAVGNPQRDYHEHFRAHAALNRLTKLNKKEKKKESRSENV
jgi:UDP-3-O-[3-hydroxymyristoyl] glucosamine N-acyltransferase